MIRAQKSLRNLFFVTLSLMSVIGYGFFVFAAPPSGGYDPGTMLDPDCAPGTTDCIVKSPLMTADNGLTVTGSNVQLGGELIQNAQIEQNGNNFSFTGGNVGINNAYADFTLDVGGTSTYSLNGSIFFSGTLDDLSVDISGYLGSTAIVYSVNISDIAGPDQINWSDSRGNSGSLLIDGSAQELSYGVLVTFSNTTGHAGDESWSFTIDKTEQGILNVSEQINLGGIYFARQNQNGSVFLGNGVEYLDDLENSFFVGGQAGLNATNASNSNFIGQNAGKNAVGAFNSNFFGSDAGQDSTGAFNSNFIGTQAGGGKFGNDSSNANFIGTQAGHGATSAANSNFLGYGAGLNATNASNSIFIGYSSGANDSVDNVSVPGWSILIGDNTNTGGFSNSIALGGSAVNTASDQFYLTDTITQMSLRGVNYTLPATDGNSGDVLTTDSIGGLTWAPAGGASLQWYAENAAAPGTAPVATGSGSIALGDGAAALAGSMFVYGSSAGGIATNAYQSNFLGVSAGYNATNANDANFFGRNSGLDATDASYSNFFGNNAGRYATNASYSNFFGESAGLSATSASNSNFLGNLSGANATNATNANFFGNGAGRFAANAYQSNFFGIYAGETATNADNSNFFGSLAGYQATNAFRSNFISQNAGYQATNASNSNFFGNSSGSAATNAYHSNFFGNSAGISATNASNSIFIGQSAGQFDTVNNTGNVNDFSILIGKSTSTGGFSNSIAIGGSATNTAANQLQIGSSTRKISSIFIGDNKGTASTNNTFFVGYKAGINATNAISSNFLGSNAGNNSTNASNSNFFGDYAGISATNANDSNFFGNSAGSVATNASNSNFFGQYAGNTATNAANSTFIGESAGRYNSIGPLGTQNAAHSIFIGTNAGYFAADNGLDNTTNPDDFSILLGNNTSTGGFENSIALGANATNTASNQFMIGSATRPIDTTRINGSASTQCTITTGTGIACTSDERVKTNIADLSSDTLVKLSNVKTVTYNWLQNPTSKTQIGFLAQDLEQYFPELVETDSAGMKSVYYAQMTPILVEAIREMNLNVTQIADVTRDNTWRDSLIAWFGNAANGIRKLFVGEIHTDMLCVGQTCVTESQLQQLLQGQNVAPVVMLDTDTTAPESNTDVSGSGDTETPTESVNTGGTDSGQENQTETPITDQNDTTENSVITPEVPIE